MDAAVKPNTLKVDTSQIFSGLAQDPVAGQLTNRQLQALALICEAPHATPMTPSKLADLLKIKPSRILFALTQAKLIRRRYEADLGDLRVIALEPTEAGRDLHQRIARLFIASQTRRARAA